MARSSTSIPKALSGDAAVSKTAEQGSIPCRGAINEALDIISWGFGSLVVIGMILLGGVAVSGALPQARFWSKVRRGEPDECWSWIGWAKSDGYGRMSVNGVEVRATHVSLEISGRPLPAGMLACHRCDNPGCVNPAHLFAGTDRDNADDRLSKGRFLQRAGTKNPRAKLTEEDVKLIRASGATNVELGKRFGVSDKTISDVRRRRIWKTIA